MRSHFHNVARIITVFALIVLVSLSFITIIENQHDLKARTPSRLIVKRDSQSPAPTSTTIVSSVTSSSSVSSDSSSSSSSSSETSTTSTSTSSTTSSTTSTTAPISTSSDTSSSSTSTSTSSSKSLDLLLSTTSSQSSTSTSSTSTTTKSSSSSSHSSSQSASTTASRTTDVIPASPSDDVSYYPSADPDDYPSSTSSTVSAAPSASTSGSAAAPTGFFENTAAVAATFTILALVGIGLVAAGVFYYLKKRRLEDIDIFNEEFGNSGFSRHPGHGGSDEYLGSAMVEHSTQPVTHAAPDAYPDRAIHYGSSPFESNAAAYYAGDQNLGLDYPPAIGGGSYRDSTASNHAGYGVFNIAQQGQAKSKQPAHENPFSDQEADMHISVEPAIGEEMSPYLQPTVRESKQTVESYYLGDSHVQSVGTAR